MRKHIDISRTIINFFDTLKTKDCKIRGNYSLLIKVKFHELEWSSPLNSFKGEIDISSLYARSDSKVSLDWIKSYNNEFVTFVQNRVLQIQKNVPSEKWNFCSTKVSLADLITRLL